MSILTSKYPPIQVPHISFGEYVYERMKIYGDKVLLIDVASGNEFTGNQLLNSSLIVAQALLNVGIVKGDIVTFFSANNVQFAIAQLSIYFLGLTTNIINSYLRPYELGLQLSKIQPTLIFASVATADVLKKTLAKHQFHTKGIFILDGECDGYTPFTTLLDTEKKKSKIPYFTVDPLNDAHIILFTSGTSGIAKGAVRTHYSAVVLQENIRLTSVWSNISINTVSCGNCPFVHLSGQLEFVTNVCNGGTLILLHRTDPEMLLASIESYKITKIGVVSPQLGKILASSTITEKYDLSSLRELGVGGQRFPNHVRNVLIEKFHLKHFYESYGSTEGGFIAFADHMNPIQVETVGNICSNTEIKIIDLVTGDILGPNHVGEICSRTPCTLKEYFKNPQATAETLDIDGWLHTGDVGFYNENECLVIVDRLKELIKFRGLHVYPAELEIFLTSHEAILDVAVIPVPNSEDCERARAFVVTHKNMQVTAETIQKYVADNFSYPKHLHGGVVFVDEIKKISVGKVDRQYYKRLVAEEIQDFNLNV